MIETGIIYGAVVICMITLSKAALMYVEERTFLPNTVINLIYKYNVLCNSCLTFWIVLLFSLSLPIASIGWIVALIVEKLKK